MIREVKRPPVWSAYYFFFKPPPRALPLSAPSPGGNAQHESRWRKKTNKQKKQNQHATRRACLSPAVKHLHKVTLTPLHSCAPLITDSTREEKTGQVWMQNYRYIPVTPHCSPDRSASGTPPADVALGEKLWNPLTRGCWIKTGRAGDAPTVGSGTTL